MRRAEVTALRWQVHADRWPTALRVARALDGESAAADVLWPELQSQRLGATEHVCIRRLHIAVRLAISQADGDAGIRRRWSLAAREALHETLDAATSTMRPAAPRAAGSSAGPGVLVGEDGDVVVYRRPHDATADLVRGLVHGDTSRAWAWRQCGLLTGAVPSSPAGRARAIAAALTARPALVPAVLAGLDAPAELPLDVGLWAAVARAWAAETASPDPGPVPAGPPRGCDAAPSRSAAPPPVPDHVVTAALRSPAGRALAAREPAVRGLPPASRTALARLALAGALPHRSWDPHVVAVVAEALAGRRVRPAGAVPDDAVPAAPAVPPVTRDATVVDDRVPAPGPPRDRAVARVEQAPPPPVVAPTAEPADPDGPGGTVSGDEREATRHGGLLFLAWPIGEVVAPDVPPAVLPGTITRLCRRLSGAGADDPAVRALSGPLTGPLTEDGLPPSGPDADRDDAVARRVRAWVGTRLRAEGPVRDRPDEVDWLWLRPALIETTPGWIEAEFSLADVDLRIRRALLDLDPGWLWWRGAVMRFRYA